MKRWLLAQVLWAACGGALAQPSEPVYTGKPITMQFQNIDLRAALQLIEISAVATWWWPTA
jgi:hypothetical protein